MIPFSVTAAPSTRRAFSSSPVEVYVSSVYSPSAARVYAAVPCSTEVEPPPGPPFLPLSRLMTESVVTSPASLVSTWITSPGWRPASSSNASSVTVRVTVSSPSVKVVIPPMARGSGSLLGSSGTSPSESPSSSKSEGAVSTAVSMTSASTEAVSVVSAVSDSLSVFLSGFPLGFSPDGFSGRWPLSPSDGFWCFSPVVACSSWDAVPSSKGVSVEAASSAWAPSPSWGSSGGCWPPSAGSWVVSSPSSRVTDVSVTAWTSPVRTVLG